jgi:small subunit ribosomal protein S1
MTTVLRKNTTTDSRSLPSANHSTQKTPSAGENADFASLLDAHLKDDAAMPKAGDKIKATIVSIGDEWIFLDIGGKSEGLLPREELADKNNAITVREGDQLEVFFLSNRNNELRFTTRIGGSDTSFADLEEACRNKIPIEGLVDKEIKGGYQVAIGKVRAFCPYSQMALRRQDDASFVGRHLQFRIMEIKNQGKSVVLSRRKLLEEEQEKRLAELRSTLEEGQRVQGTVTSIRDFGAFVDIGGIEGLVPAQEISWDTYQQVSDILAVGDRIEVEILSLDWQRQRLAFSLKRVGADPWDEIDRNFGENTTVNGTVSKLMPFGAFIRLGPGVEGLVHISRLGDRKLNHPREALDEQQPLSVRIEKLDKEKRRISLVPTDPSQLKTGAKSTEMQHDDTEQEEVDAFLKARKQEKSGTMTMKELFQKALAEKKE